MDKIYDLLILGAGPAGITAYVYAARKKMDFALITLDIGGQAAWSGDIENYTGFQFVTGPELAEKFEEHMKAFNAEVRMPEKVLDIRKDGELVAVDTDRATYYSRALIVALGKRPKELNVEGEREFRNRGVTYCATCDGPLFQNKNVAVVGGGNSALDAALQMIKISPSVHLINIAPQCTGDPVMAEKVRNAPNVTLWHNASVSRILGNKFVTGIEIEQKGQKHLLDVQGVFIEVGLAPNSEPAEILKKNERNEIIVDHYNRTSVEGIFAAGDITDVPEKQIIVACGEGAKACLSAFRYLSTRRFSS